MTAVRAARQDDFHAWLALARDLEPLRQVLQLADGQKVLEQRVALLAVFEQKQRVRQPVGMRGAEFLVGHADVLPGAVFSFYTLAYGCTHCKRDGRGKSTAGTKG